MKIELYTRCDDCHTDCGQYPVQLECPHCAGRLRTWMRDTGIFARLFGEDRPVVGGE